MSTIKIRFPHTPLLVVSMSDESEVIYRLFLAEVDGFILKNSGKAELFAAIDDLLLKGMHYEKAIMAQILKKQRSLLSPTRQNSVQLSPREMEVLKLILAENTSRQIAEQLFISKQTVDTHRIHIYEKTGTQTLVGLIKFALEREWI